MTRKFSTTLAIVFCTGCLACSTGRDAVSMPATRIATPAWPLQGSLPGLPDDAQLPSREASAGLSITIAGEEFHEAVFDIANGGMLQLTAPPDGVQWAIYRFSGVAGDADISSITANLASFNGGLLYSLLSDYASGHWRVADTQAASGGQVLPIYSGSAQGLVSPAGNLYVGLLAYDGASTVIDNLTLLGNGDLQPPQNFTAKDGVTPDFVDMSWDPAPGAGGYYIEYKLANEPEQAYGRLVSLPGIDNTAYAHSATQPPAKPCVYGEVYEYRVQSWTNSETSVEFSNSDTGYRQLPPVKDFFVSERVYEDKVAISGFYFDDSATAVNLWRDGQFLDPLPLTNKNFSYNDVPGDSLPHVYQVFASGPEGLSPPSAEKTGCQVSWNHDQIALGDGTDQTYADFAVVNGVPAIAYWQEQTETIHYAYANEAQPTGWTDVALPGTAAVNARMSLLDNGGVPWIAFSHGTVNPGDPHGLNLVYSSVPEPTSTPEFNNGYRLYPDKCEGFSVKLRLVNGGLAAVYADRDLGNSDQLQYAWSALPAPAVDDWQMLTAGALPDESIYEFDMEELDGRPCVIFQTGKGLYFKLADSAAPANAGDWAGHAIFSNLSPSLGGASGVDLVVQDNLPYLACTWGQLETDGVVYYLLPDQPQIPVDELGWNGGVISSFNDREPDNISMVFLDGKPWITWSDQIESEAWLATPINHQIGYLNGFWHQVLVPGEAGFDRAWRPAGVLEIDGGIGVFYSSKNVDLDPDKLETIYAWWQPKP